MENIKKHKKICPVVENVVIIVTPKIHSTIFRFFSRKNNSMAKAIHNAILYIGASLNMPQFLIYSFPKKKEFCASKYK